MIEFKVTKVFQMMPEAFIDNIFDVENWPDYEGYGPLPGVKFAVRSDFSEARMGTKFEVTNTDGSTHVETVTAFVPGELLVLEFSEFTKPLSSFVTHFIETFQLERVDGKTKLVRMFQIFPRNFFGKIMFSILSVFLKKAIANHLDKIIQVEKSK